MHPAIPRLVELQRVDHQIAVLRAELEGFPKRIREAETKLGGARADVASAKEAHAQIVAERKKFELDGQQWKDRARKYRDQSGAVKTNEAYKALQHEIANAEAEVAKSDDRQLEVMMAAEEIERRVKICASFTFVSPSATTAPPWPKPATGSAAGAACACCRIFFRSCARKPTKKFSVARAAASSSTRWNRFLSRIRLLVPRIHPRRLRQIPDAAPPANSPWKRPFRRCSRGAQVGCGGVSRKYRRRLSRQSRAGFLRRSHPRRPRRNRRQAEEIHRPHDQQCRRVLRADCGDGLCTIAWHSRAARRERFRASRQTDARAIQSEERGSAPAFRASAKNVEGLRFLHHRARLPRAEPRGRRPGQRSAG